MCSVNFFFSFNSWRCYQECEFVEGALNTVAELLEHLGVLKTHNRPYTSNDNPFSESQFKTLKYCPQLPIQFDSLEESEAFCKEFFKWYNELHYHSGILWLTPHTVQK